MSANEKINLPNEHYRQEYPISKLRQLADLAIQASAETPRGPFLESIAKEMGGSILGNTDFVTTHDYSGLRQWLKRPVKPTEAQLAASRQARTRFSEPALFNYSYQYPGWTIRIKRHTDGSPVRDINGKPETYVFENEGQFMYIRGLKYSFKDSRLNREGQYKGKLNEHIVPSAVRAYGRRSDIKFGLDLPVLPDFSLDPDRPISAAFSQKSFGIHFGERAINETARGNPAAVFFAARAAIRGMLGGSMRVYQPELELARAMESGQTEFQMAA